MDTPNRLLKIFDLAKKLGFVHSLPFDKNEFGPNGIKYRYTKKSVESRIKRHISNIIKKESVNPKISKDDRLEDKHISGRGAGSKNAIYDRNQFIRSYFRYKESTIKYSFSTDEDYKPKEDEFYPLHKSKKLFIKDKEVPLLTQQPVSDKHINYEDLAVLCDKLYSFTEIAEFCFPPCFYSNTFNEWNEESPSVYGIDFPLRKSTIETIAKFYGIDSIKLDKATEPFIFYDDLMYLAGRSIALKYRRFIVSNLHLQFEKKEVHLKLEEEKLYKGPPYNEIVNRFLLNSQNINEINQYKESNIIKSGGKIQIKRSILSEYSSLHQEDNPPKIDLYKMLRVSKSYYWLSKQFSQNRLKRKDENWWNVSEWRNLQKIWKCSRKIHMNCVPLQISGKGNYINDIVGYTIELVDVPTQKKEQKAVGIPGETVKKYVYKMYWTNTPLYPIVSRLFTPSKDASPEMKKEYQIVAKLFRAKFNYGNRHDYNERAIDNFFSGLKPNQKILAIFDGEGKIETIEGCASYDQLEKKIKVNGCTIPVDKLTHLRVMTEN